MSLPDHLSDTEMILVVLGVLYVFECVVWVRGTAICFVQAFARRARLSRPALLFERDSGGPVLGSLLPFGRTLLCEPWPVAVGPKGVCGFVATSLSASGRPPQAARYVPFDEIREIKAVGKEVLINQSSFLATSSQRIASVVAEELSAISRLPIAEREGAILALLDRTMDFDAAAARLAEAKKVAGHLRVSCSFLFVQIFLIGPWLYYWFSDRAGAYRLLAIYLFTILMVWVDVAVTFALGHRRLYVGATGVRRQKVLSMCVSPVVAMRAWDLISRDLAAAFHPLATAAAICSESERSSFAAFVVRDARFPVLPPCPLEDADAVETEAWFRARTGERIAAMAQRIGLDPDRPLLVEAREAGALSYCPRCGGQFEIESAECLPCGGRVTIRFSETEAAAAGDLRGEEPASSPGPAH